MPSGIYENTPNNDLLQYDDREKIMLMSILLDISGSMQKTNDQGKAHIEVLADATQKFINEAKRDNNASILDLNIITFGTNAKVVQPFTNISNVRFPGNLIASGSTNVCEALKLSLDCIDKRLKDFYDNRLRCYKPWIVLVSDGYPTNSASELEEITRLCRYRMNETRDVKIWAFGVGGVNPAFLRDLTDLAYTSNEMSFDSIMDWAKKSVITLRNSKGSTHVDIDEPRHFTRVSI